MQTFAAGRTKQSQALFLRDFQCLSQRETPTNTCNLHSILIVVESTKFPSRAGLLASQRSSLPLSSRLACISSSDCATLP